MPGKRDIDQRTAEHLGVPRVHVSHVTAQWLRDFAELLANNPSGVYVNGLGRFKVEPPKKLEKPQRLPSPPQNIAAGEPETRLVTTWGPRTRFESCSAIRKLLREKFKLLEEGTVT